LPEQGHKLQNLRAGLIGLGKMGRHHARILSNLDGVDLVGVTEPGQYEIAWSQGRPVFQSLAELIDQDIDFAVVAVPTSAHLEIVEQLAAGGIHCLIEKPISDNLLDSNKIKDIFFRANLIGAVGHIERYNPAIQEARRRIEQLGRILQIATRRQGPLPARITDVGVVLDLATHDIDLTSWISQQSYSKLSAQTVSLDSHKHEDLLVAMAVLDNGIIASHLVNWVSPLKERVVTITGELGTFVADTLTADLTFFANGSTMSDWEGLAHLRGVSEGEITRYAINKREPLLVELENFRDALLGKPSEIVTLDQATSNIAVAERMLESARLSASL
jgi:predicted dehydrogenase